MFSAIQTSLAQYHEPKSIDASPTLSFVISIIIGLAGVALLACGLCAHFKLGLLASLNPAISLTMMVSGGTVLFGSIILACVCKKQAPKKENIPPKTTSEPAVSTPKFIYAPMGVNQYGEGGVSACTRISCRFLAYTPQAPANPESIQKAIQGHGYLAAAHEETDLVISQYPELKMETNPWLDQQFTPEMQVSLTPGTSFTFESALLAISNDKKITAAIITGQMMTVAMRKQNNHFEFFDSHGSAEITQGADNSAYVFCTDLKGASTYLEKRFPRVEGIDDIGYNTITIYPLSHK